MLRVVEQGDERGEFEARMARCPEPARLTYPHNPMVPPLEPISLLRAFRIDGDSSLLGCALARQLCLQLQRRLDTVGADLLRRVKNREPLRISKGVAGGQELDAGGRHRLACGDAVFSVAGPKSSILPLIVAVGAWRELWTHRQGMRPWLIQVAQDLLAPE